MPNGLERWPADGGGPGSTYERSFQELLLKMGFGEDTHYFDTLLKTRKAAGKPTRVLDLMGSGYFIREAQNADAIVGMRLAPLRTQTEWERANPRDEVLGDIFLPETWQRLDEYMARHQLSHFDLIVMRPIAGWNAISFDTKEEEAEALVWLVRQAMRRLAGDGGFYSAIHEANTFLLPPWGRLEEMPALQSLQREIQSGTGHSWNAAATWDPISERRISQIAILPKN